MKKFFPVILCMLFLLSFVSAQPPFQQSSQEIGIIIEASVEEVHKLESDFFFNIHVHNSTNGLLLTNQTTSCIIHLFRPSDGVHILEETMTFDINGVDFDTVITSGNFTELGQYSVLFNCEVPGEIGGFLSYGFDITYTGKKIPTGFDGRFILLLCFVLLILGLAYLQKEINFDKWYQGILTKYNKRNFFRTFISKLGFFFMNNPFSLFYMIGLFIILLMYDVTKAYVLVDAYSVIEVLVMIYLFGMFFIFIEILGDIHEFFSRIAEDIKGMGWGLSGESGLGDVKLGSKHG